MFINVYHSRVLNHQIYCDSFFYRIWIFLVYQVSMSSFALHANPATRRRFWSSFSFSPVLCFSIMLCHTEWSVKLIPNVFLKPAFLNTLICNTHSPTHAQKRVPVRIFHGEIVQLNAYPFTKICVLRIQNWRCSSSACVHF